MPQHLSGNKEGCTHELCHAQAHIEVSRGFSHNFPFSEVTTKLIGLRRKDSNSGPATLSVFPCSAPGYRFSLLPSTAVGASRNLIASCSTKAVIRGISHFRFHEQYSQAIGAPPSVLGLAEVNLCPLHIFPTCSFGKHEDCTVLRRKKAENNYSDNTAEERKNMEVLGGLSLLNGGYRLLAYIFRARALQFSAYTHLGRLLWGAFFTDSNMLTFTSSSPVPRILLCWQMIRPQKRTERRYHILS